METITKKYLFTIPSYLIFLLLTLSIAAGNAAADTVMQAGNKIKESLTLVAEQGKISGSFIYSEMKTPQSLSFSSIENVAGEFAVSLQVSGKNLSAFVDKNNQSAKLNGVNDQGKAVFLNEKDRRQIRALLQKYEQGGYGEQSDAANILKRSISLWAQTPDTVALQRAVEGISAASHESLCNDYGAELSATHDGNQCDDYDPECTSLAVLGSRGSSVTESFINGQWTTAIPDHLAYVKQRGECYGNCGSGCPSGDQILTRDCLNHDQCVRNGHALASWWCDDEFTSTADDYFFAPECPGTGE